jgi:uncharacterized damage-inducible protein DinB
MMSAGEIAGEVARKNAEMKVQRARELEDTSNAAKAEFQQNLSEAPQKAKVDFLYEVQPTACYFH